MKPSYRSTAVLIVFSICFSPLIAVAQAPFKAGDRVEASPMYLKDDQYYKPCTVKSFVSGSYILDCGGTEYSVSPAYVRTARSQNQEPASVPVTPPVAGQADGQFKIGQRVMATVKGLKGDRYYQPCTVASALHDDVYELDCDAFNGQSAMSFSVRPGWIKAWDNPTAAPIAECPFYKDYEKVSNTAPASAGLFKSVIFEWQRSIQDFYDFGLTFQSFELGRTFRNRAIGNGRKDVDTAPVGATIHNVKARELICQRSSTITKRWVRDIEYACYKNEYGTWVCKNGAPKNIEQTSIPIKN